MEIYNAFVGHFESPSFRHHLVVLISRVWIRNQLAVNFKVNPSLRHLVDVNLRTWNRFLNLLSHYTNQQLDISPFITMQTNIKERKITYSRLRTPCTWLRHDGYSRCGTYSSRRLQWWRRRRDEIVIISASFNLFFICKYINSKVFLPKKYLSSFSPYFP